MATKNNDRASLEIITPRGVAIYPKLNAPSYTFHKEGEYEVKLRIDPTVDAADAVLNKKAVTFADLVSAIEAQQEEFLEAKRKELAGSKDGKNKAKAKTIESVEFGTEDVDDDGNPTGLRVVKLKMKASGVSSKDGKSWTRKPKLFDAKGRPLPESAPPIWGGSVLKVAARAVPYYMPKENVVGTTLYMEAVQVLELVSGQGRTAEAYGFGAEDGYETEDESAAGGFADESTDDGAAAGPNF